MRGDVVEPQRENMAMARGNYLEGGVLAWWQDRHPDHFQVEPQFYATRDDLPWAAATLDALAWNNAEGYPVAVEVKTTSRMDEWGDPGTDAIPTHYLVQTYWQMAMAPHVRRVYVAVLGPFLDFSEYVVERPDDALLDDLITRCQTFHDSLSGDVPPELDDSVATFQTLRAQRGRVEKKATVYVDVSLASEWVNARAAEEAATSRARLADSRLIEAIGNAQYAHTESGRFARQQDNRNRPIPLIASLSKETAA
jgi:hypothetical protein